MSGRHRRGWPDRVPLLLVPVLIVGAPLAFVWLGAGLYLLGRLAVRCIG